jgi:thymidylate kinase
MKIILDGPDGSGKTTLANLLTAHYRLKYTHLAHEDIKGPPVEFYARALLQDNVLLDRWALSERVYGEALRDGDPIGRKGWRMLNRVIQATGALMFTCLPHPDVGLRVFNERIQRKKIPDNETYLKVYSLFAYHSSRLKIPVVQATDSPELDLRPSPCYWRGVLGSRTARVLIVGDRSRHPETEGLPFTSLKGCGPYLTKALDLAGYHDEDLAFVNAFYHSSSDQPGNRRYQLPKTNAVLQPWAKVVALGKNAYSCARDLAASLAVPVITAPHPAFWKRFHYKEIEAYASKLRGLT